jgi:flagellar basal-body rod protein FlgG
MAYDIPTVATAMDQKIVQLDYITHNLANATTPGFKAQHLHALRSLAEANQTDENAPSGHIVFTDFSQGLSQKTDNPLDLSIQGDGFFAVQTPDGEAFTRQGDFTVNKLNQIVTQSGHPVVGAGGGPITLTDGKVQIGEDGSVYVNKNEVESEVGKLKIVDFSDRQALLEAGGGLYRDSGSAGMKKIEKPSIARGSVESSNVNIVKEMAEMIDIHRSFETYQKIIQTLSEEDKLSTGRVGRIG